MRPCLTGATAPTHCTRSRNRSEVSQSMVQREPGKPDQQYNPDAVLARQFGVGCIVLVLAFLLMTALVWWFWTH